MSTKENNYCKYFDCGWCYKDGSKYANSGCVGTLKCDYISLSETEFVYKGNTFISKEIPLEKLYDERRDVCKGCYFIDNCDEVYEEGFILPPCNAGNRDDNIDVIFKLKK